MKKKVLSGVVLLAFALSAPAVSECRMRSKIDTPTLRMAERIAKKHGVPAKLVKAIVCQESECGANPVSRREHSKSWSRTAKKVTSDPREYEALMHSYGAMQLSGLYTYLEYGVAPHELLEDETNLEVGCARLAKELQACRRSEYCAAARWNGGSRPNAQARKYAHAVMKWKELV